MKISARLPVLLVFGATFCAAAPAAYFDALDTSQPPPREFTVRVPHVVPGRNADKAGLRAGDEIAGLNGLRVRCRADIVLLRRRFAKTEADVTLNVVRGNRWHEVTLPNRDSIQSWTSFRRENPDAGTARRLVLWGVKIETLPSYDTNPVTGEKIPPPTRAMLRGRRPGYSAGQLFSSLVLGAPAAADRGEAAARAEQRFREAVEKFGNGAQPWHALENSNFRMQEALCKLADQGGVENREWAEGLVRTLRCLLMEDFDAALEHAEPLLGREVEPFLDELAKFYAAAARERAGFGEGGGWQKCGVDADFFAICYPWPTVPKTHAPDVFAFNPAMQSAYNLRLQEGGETSRVRASAAQALLRQGNGLSAGLQYRSQVAAALVDTDNHGGWPYRSSLLRDPARLMAALRENWENHPSERNLTAFALLAPAAQLEDEAMLRLALRQIYAMGHAEIGDAHFILSRTLNRNVEKQAAMVHRVWSEEERAALEVPQIYRWLEPRCAVVHARLQRCFHIANQNGDAAAAFQKTPWFIAEALLRGDEPQTLRRLLEVPEIPARELRREAPELLRQYAENFYWAADMQSPEILPALLRQVPQEAAHHNMLALMKERDEFFSLEGIHFLWSMNSSSAPWLLWLSQYDAPAHKAAQDAAQNIRGGAPAALDNALRNAATPAALVVLARAAQEAGEAGLAQKFLGMAETFHRHGLTLHNEPMTSLWGARAFLGEPGHGAFSAELLEASAEPKTRAWHALMACHALQQGAAGDAREYLAHALNERQSPPARPHEPKTLIFYGEILSVDAYAAKIQELITATLTGNYGPMPPPPVPW